MKKTIFLIIIISFNCLYAQNIEPNALNFRYPNSQAVPATQDFFGADRFPQNNFIIGWWWGHDLRSADNLNSNMVATWSGANNNYVIFTETGLINSTGHPEYTIHNNKIKIIPALQNFPSSGESIQFEPTLLIEQNDPEKFKPLISNGKEGAHSIFGFQGGIIANNHSPSPIDVDNNDPEYIKYRLKLNSTESYANPILSNPWINNQFTRFGKKVDIGNTIFNRTTEANAYYNLIYYGGAGWFVTINFRLEDNLPGTFNNPGTLANSTSILKIQIPYHKNTSSGYIRFMDVPYSLNPPGFDFFIDNPNEHNRGGFYFNPPLSNNNETIDITAGFLRTIQDGLPTGQSLYQRDITISAYFKCQPNGIPNPLPRYEFDKTDNDNEDFQTLGMDVDYLGHLSLSIDWLRIGNPLSLASYQGWLDNDWWTIQRLIDFVNDKPGGCIDGHGDVINDQAYNITNFKGSVNIGTNYELFRIYGGSGHDGTCIWNWGMKRYWNKLFPNMLVQSIGPELSDQYHWYVGSKERWEILPALKGGYASPAYYPSTNQYNRYGLNNNCGLRGDPGNWNAGDNFTLNSGYETSILYPSYNTSGNLTAFTVTNPLPTGSKSIIQMIREEQAVSYQGNTISADKLYKDAINDYNATHSFQARWENGAFGGIFTNLYEKHADKFLYNGINWWGQIFITPSWHIRNNVFTSGYFRPNTGEEISLMCFTALVLGAKGFTYDRLGDESFKIDNFTSPIKNKDQDIFNGPCFPNNISRGVNSIFSDEDPALSNGSTLQRDFEYLKNNRLGPDFLKTDDRSLIPWYLDENINAFSPLQDGIDDFADYLGVPHDRVYLGAESNRLTLRKVHDFAMENSQTLLNLRLVSWYAKGFRTWTSHHPKVPIEKIKYFIKVPDKMENLEANIPLKVRPISREKDGKPDFEPPDSTFYDITLLAETGDSQTNEEDLDCDGNNDIKSMDKVFYIGVLNRRTDPLILNGYGPDDASHGYGVDFYSSAEFDDFVVNGGNDIQGVPHNASYWQERWWKRLGCREITIPLNVNSANPNNYKLVKVTELSRNDYKEFKDASGNYLITTVVLSNLLPKVSTIVGQDGTFTAKFLPGEGKIFKCEVIARPNTLSGSLAHSNQSKLVGFTDFNGDLVYHLVYHKVVSNGLINNNTVKVFYKRSVPIILN